MSALAGRVVAMANDIARNVPPIGDEDPAAATARHIRAFWDPRMIAALVDGPQDGLVAAARGAVRILSGTTG